MQIKPPILITYWIGEEPSPPSPILTSIPTYVDIIPLAFITITPSLTLDFTFLTQRFSAAQIKSWIHQIHLRSPSTKLLFSINDPKLGSIPLASIPTFVSNVVSEMEHWSIDGLDFDFEPPYPSATLIPLITALRTALAPRHPVFTAPVYAKWLYSTATQSLLSDLAGVVDYVTTMDYTPYPGLAVTEILCRQYAALTGGTSQLCVGVSCMDASRGNFTPLGDVEELSRWEDGLGRERKAGMMVYNFSYDIRKRTGREDGAWTRTVFENMRGAGRGG